MNQMMVFTPNDIINLVLKICAAIAAVSVAINWIIQWVQRAGLFQADGGRRSRAKYAGGLPDTA